MTTAFCPRCGGDLEIDEDALVHKRAACAPCGREIELSRAVLGRAAGTALVPAKGATGFARIDPPPTRRLRVRPDGTISLRGDFWRVSFFWVLVLALFLVVPVVAVYHFMLVPAILGLVLVAVGPRAELSVEGDALVLRRGLLRRETARVPLSAIGEIRAGHMGVRIARACEYPIELTGFSLDEAEAGWTARQVTHAVRQARLEKRRP